MHNDIALKVKTLSPPGRNIFKGYWLFYACPEVRTFTVMKFAWLIFKVAN